MDSFFEKISFEKLLLVTTVSVNILFLLSCFFTSSTSLFLCSFALEAYYSFKYRKRKTLLLVYHDFNPLYSLVKAALLGLSSNNLFMFIPFLIMEVYLLAFYRAGFYFEYQASSLPCLNFKNFGLLRGLYEFNKKLSCYQTAYHIRPFVHFCIASLLVLRTSFFHYGLTLFVIAATALFCWFCFASIRYFIYTISKAYKKDMADHIKHHSPEVVVYVSGAPGSVYQLAQWVPVLERLEKRVTVIARERFWVTDLEESPIHTVFAQGLEDIGNFITSDTKVCLYPANAFKNTQMMRRAEMEHIFINHGESDKIVNVSRLIRAYSKLYLAGPMAKDRLQAAGISLGKDQYTYVGRPQTSIFLEKSNEKTHTILYAPTWEGFDSMSNYNSVDTLALDIIKEIIDQSEYDIIFKPHPLTGTVKSGLRNKLTEIQKFLNESGRGQYVIEGNILEVMNQCDLLVTDISSVMNDFLETKKPYIVTNPSGVPLPSFEVQFLTVKGGYILNKSDEILNILRTISQNDPKKTERERIRKYSLGDFTSSALEKFKIEIDKDCQSVKELWF